MKVEITQTDYFYKEGEQYDVSENTRWGCYMVEQCKSLIRVTHAKKIESKKKYYSPPAEKNHYADRQEVFKKFFNR